MKRILKSKLTTPFSCGVSQGIRLRSITFFAICAFSQIAGNSFSAAADIGTALSGKDAELSKVLSQPATLERFREFLGYAKLECPSLSDPQTTLSFSFNKKLSSNHYFDSFVGTITTSKGERYSFVGNYDNYGRKLEFISVSAVDVFAYVQDFQQFFKQELDTFVVAPVFCRTTSEVKKELVIYRHVDELEHYEKAASLPFYMDPNPSGGTNMTAVNSSYVDSCGRRQLELNTDWPDPTKRGGNGTRISETYNWVGDAMVLASTAVITGGKVSVTKETIPSSSPCPPTKSHMFGKSPRVRETELLKAISEMSPADAKYKAFWEAPFAKLYERLAEYQSSFSEQVFHAFLKKYMEAQDPVVKKEVNEALWIAIAERKVFMPTEPNKAELKTTIRDLYDSLYDWHLPRNKGNSMLIQPQESYQKGGLDACFIYSDFVVLRHGLDEIGDATVYQNPHKKGSANCELEPTGAIFTATEQNSQNFFKGLYKSYLIMDEGTGNARDLYLFDFKKKKLVKSRGYYSSDPSFKNGKLIFGTDHATHGHDCKGQLSEKKKQEGYRQETVNQTIIDLDHDLSESESGAHCEENYYE